MLFRGITISPSPDTIARLCELAWWDGLRTGGVAGLLIGVVVGIVVAALLRTKT